MIYKRESFEVLVEGYFMNTKDIEFNMDKLTNKPGQNVLIMTGLSGSGKTTLSAQYAKKLKASVIELDAIERCEKSNTIHNQAMVYLTKKSSDYKKLYAFITGPSVPGVGLNIDIDDLWNEIIPLLVEFCYSRRGICILEGVQIFTSTYNSNDIPLVIKGTSMVLSILRRFSRNGDGTIDWSSELKNEFFQLVRWYISDNKELNKFKKRIR